MRGIVEESLARRHLDDFPGVHNGHVVCHFRHHAQIVGDQQDGHAHTLLQTAQQFQNLRLDGDVQRGGRLIRDQQAGLACQRYRNHHSLLHAAGELERVLVDTSGGIRNAHRVQQLDHPGADLAPAQHSVALQNLGNLRTHGHHRIQARAGLLENHADPASAHAPHRDFRQLQQLATLEPHRARHDAAGVRKQARDRQRRHRLATAGFTQQGKGFAAFDRKGQPVHSAHSAFIGGQPG